jgi:uncharacterized membrane protein YjjB (DUF3815 family)
MTAQTKKILIIGAVGVAAYLVYRQMNKPTVVNTGLALPTAYNPNSSGPVYTNNTAQIISAAAPAVTALATQISSWFQKPVSPVPTTTTSGNTWLI